MRSKSRYVYDKSGRLIGSGGRYDRNGALRPGAPRPKTRPKTRSFSVPKPKKPFVVTNTFALSLDPEKKPRRRSRTTRAQPRNFLEVIERIKQNGKLNVGIEMLKQRSGEFANPLTMTLVGIALHQPARDYFDAQLDRIWAKETLPKYGGEVIIGAGFHAAVYASVRVAAGFPKPLVLEASDRVGGAFAISRNPSFYLNSRNRPGRLGIPGRAEALNVIPCGPVQPADLSGAEYQHNSDLAFAIRCALALNARVVTGFKANKRIGRSVYDNGRIVSTQRLIYATGIGEPQKPILHERLFNFDEFMARMDDPFPLRGMNSVAVVGAGDSGKTAVEALIGQAPITGMSVAALDFPERIDWYGVPADARTAGGWEGCNRSRYKGIARAFSKGGNISRVTPRSAKARVVNGGYDGVIVNGRMYDHVIWCSGYSDETGGSLRRNPNDLLDYQMVDARAVARGLDGRETFEIGPAAGLPFDELEADALPAAVPENTVALFRYADRTATFASTMPKVK